MISQIDITGFRSIKEQSIPLKKLNILYGQNGSGKSSVMYAPYAFRNFCVNPNQQLDSLFNLGFIHLGGFDGIMTKSNSKIYHTGVIIHKKVEVENGKDLQFGLKLRKNNSNFIFFKIDASAEHGFGLQLPYSLTNKIELKYDDIKLL